MKEAAEAEVAPVFEEIAAHNPLMVKVAAAFDTVSIEIAIPIGAIEQAPVAVLVAQAVPIAKPPTPTIAASIWPLGLTRTSMISPIFCWLGS